MEQATYQAWVTEREESARFKADALRQMEAKEAERLDALAKAGKWEESHEALRKEAENGKREWQSKYEQLDSRVLAKVRDATIAEALNGRSFAGDPVKTAALVRRLLADEIETSRDAQGNEIVYDRVTRRPAADYLKERLESPDFAIFFTANNRGGAGTDGTRSAGPPTPQQPGSLESIAARYKQNAATGFGLSRVS
jgi:hypothetical protein